MCHPTSVCGFRPFWGAHCLDIGRIIMIIIIILMIIVMMTITIMITALITIMIALLHCAWISAYPRRLRV